MAILPTPGVTPGPDWAVGVNDALLESMLSRIFPVGQLANVLHHNPVGGGGYLYTQGYEHAIGVLLPQMTIDAFQVCIQTAAAAPAAFRVGLRKVGNNHLIGAPIFDQDVPSTSTGDKLIVLPAPIALDGGLYCITWVVYGESTPTLKPWAGPQVNPFPVVNMNFGTQATGILSMAMRINSGITTPALPASVVITGLGGNFQPIQFNLRRSA